jgi:uncharacterized membrane protein
VAGTRRGFERLVNFTDAIVAIAITLLILPLVDIAPSIAREPVGRLLSKDSNQLVAFGISFVVIAALWIGHHRIFERIGSYDQPLIRLTLVWLITVVFLPFPTALVGVHTDRGTAVLYIATLLASSLALHATSTWVDRHPELRVEGPAGARDNDSTWTTPVLLAIALVLTASIDAVRMWSLLLLLLSMPIDAALARRRRGREPRTAPPPAARTG